MHEHSVLRALMQDIERVATDAGTGRIVALRVWLGASSHLSEAHFREHFAHLAQGTVAAGARLEVESSVDEWHPDAQGVRLVSVEVPA